MIDHPRRPGRFGRRAAVVASFVAGLLLLAPPVGAGEPIEPSDSTTGYDHVSQPPPGAASSADWCFAFSDEDLIGQTIVVTATGPTGTVTGESEVGDDGTVRVRVGITQGGTYTIVEILAVDSARSVSSDAVAAIDVVFDPEVVDCLSSLEVPVSPDTTLAPTTTGPTTTASSTVESTPTTPVEDDSTPGTSNLPFTLVVVGILLLFVGALISYFPAVATGTSSKCVPQRRKVESLEKQLAAAEAAEKKARAESERLLKEADRVRYDATVEGGKRHSRADALLAKRNDVDHAVANHQAHVRTLKEALEKARRALKQCLERADPTPPTAPGGGTAPPASTPKKKHPDCCPAGNWVGINLYTGGMVLVGGLESGVTKLWCIEDPDRTAVIRWTGTRLGLGLGGEGSAGLLVVVGGGVHPYELQKSVAGVLAGVDFDVSIGVSWTKLLKGAGKAGRSGKRWKELFDAVGKAREGSKALKTARKSGTIEDATKIATKHADVFEKLIREGAADDIAEIVTKSAASGAQAGGKGVHIPHGKGAQIGVWALGNIKTALLDLDGCKNCDPSKSP